MKKPYNTLYESKYYKQMTKKMKPDCKETFDELFQAANIVHMAAQKCVGDHGETAIMHIRFQENNLLIEKVLKKYPQAKAVISAIDQESKSVNKNKYNRMIEDKLANTMFVIQCLEEEAKKYPAEEMQ